MARHGNNIASGYIEWNSNRARDVALPARDDSIHPAFPLPERLPTKLELLRQELEIERKKNLDRDSSYQTELGQYKYFMKIQEDKVKDERKERELLVEDFKELGLKNKRLEDDLKGKGGRPSKRVKLMEDSRKELQEAQKEAQEQRKLTNYWKKLTQKVRGKRVEKRQTWESKYKIDTGKQSEEITELKLKLRAEKIRRAELQAEKTKRSKMPFARWNSP